MHLTVFGRNKLYIGGIAVRGIYNERVARPNAVQMTPLAHLERTCGVHCSL